MKLDLCYNWEWGVELANELMLFKLVGVVYLHWYYWSTTTVYLLSPQYRPSQEVSPLQD